MDRLKDLDTSSTTAVMVPPVHTGPEERKWWEDKNPQSSSCAKMHSKDQLKASTVRVRLSKVTNCPLRATLPLVQLSEETLTKHQKKIVTLQENLSNSSVEECMFAQEEEDCGFCPHHLSFKN